MSKWQPIETAPTDGTWVLVSGYEPINLGDSRWGEEISDLHAVPARYVSGDAPIYEAGRLHEWESCLMEINDDYYGGQTAWPATVYPSVWMPMPAPPKRR